MNVNTDLPCLLSMLWELGTVRSCSFSVPNTRPSEPSHTELYNLDLSYLDQSSRPVVESEYH